MRLLHSVTRGLLLSLTLTLSAAAAGCAGDTSDSDDDDVAATEDALGFADAAKFFERMMQVFTRNADDIGRLHQNISNADRINIIRRVPVSEILSAPGHRQLRSPSAVTSMAKAIEQAGDGGRAFVRGKEKIVLNVFTKVVTSEDGATQKVVIRGIEVMDGNHRLAAGVLAKLGETQDNLAAGLRAKRHGRSVWQTIGDIPEEALEIRVNGDLPLGAGRPSRWIPVKIFEDASCTGPCAELKGGRRGTFRIITDDRGGRAAEVSGSLSSLDPTIPSKFRGVTMFDVLKTSLNAGEP